MDRAAGGAGHTAAHAMAGAYAGAERSVLTARANLTRLTPWGGGDPCQGGTTDSADCRVPPDGRWQEGRDPLAHQEMAAAPVCKLIQKEDIWCRSGRSLPKRRTPADVLVLLTMNMSQKTQSCQLARVIRRCSNTVVTQLKYCLCAVYLLLWKCRHNPRPTLRRCQQQNMQC
jgi:hypothetical protein